MTREYVWDGAVGGASCCRVDVEPPRGGRDRREASSLSGVYGRSVLDEDAFACAEVERGGLRAILDDCGEEVEEVAEVGV